MLSTFIQNALLIMWFIRNLAGHKFIQKVKYVIQRPCWSHDNAWFINRFLYLNIINDSLEMFIILKHGHQTWSITTGLLFKSIVNQRSTKNYNNCTIECLYSVSIATDGQFHQMKKNCLMTQLLTCIVIFILKNHKHDKFMLVAWWSVHKNYWCYSNSLNS